MLLYLHYGYRDKRISQLESKFIADMHGAEKIGWLIHAITGYLPQQALVFFVFDFWLGKQQERTNRYDQEKESLHIG